MMESWLRRRKIWVYTQVVDFRKQLDGLVGIIGNEMGLKAEDGLYGSVAKYLECVIRARPLWREGGQVLGIMSKSM